MRGVSLQLPWTGSYEATFHLILLTSPQGLCYWPRFTDRETEAQKGQGHSAARQQNPGLFDRVRVS